MDDHNRKMKEIEDYQEEQEKRIQEISKYVNSSRRFIKSEE